MTENLEQIDIVWSVSNFEGEKSTKTMRQVEFKSVFGPKFDKTSHKVDAISIDCEIKDCNGPAVLDKQTDYFWINDLYQFQPASLQTAKIENNTMIFSSSSLELYIDKETKFTLYMNRFNKSVQGITIRVWTRKIEKTTISSAIGNLEALTKQRNQMAEQMSQLQEQIKQIDKKIETAVFCIKCASKTTDEECKQTREKLEKIEQILKKE